MAALYKFKIEHIAVYGPDNHMRLTSLHATGPIDMFDYGVAHRGASLRISQKHIVARLTLPCGLWMINSWKRVVSSLIIPWVVAI